MVRKKGNLWYAVVYAGRKDGKSIKKESKGFKRKQDATKKETEMKAEVYKLRHKIYEDDDFGAVVNQYFELNEKLLAETTFRNYKFYYKKYIEERFSTRQISTIRKIDIEKFKLSMMDYAPETYNKAFGLLKNIFDFAIETLEILPENSNPCTGVKRRRVQQSKIVTWNQKQITQFLSMEETRLSKYRIGFLIIFSTGMRPGEVCGLQFGDIEGDYFILNRGLNRYGHDTNMKNEYAHDKMYINPSLKKALKIHRKIMGELMLGYGHKIENDDYILTLEPDFRPVKPEVLSKAFQKIIKKSNLPKMRLYDARHSLATNMMRDGINPKIVSEIMRHSTVKTTLDLYSHPDDEMRKNALDMYDFG